MDISTGVFLFIIGIIAGGYGTIVGAGGGFIFVPALLIILNMNPLVAAASGLVIVLINSLSSVLGYAKLKKINYKIAMFIGISAMPGSLLGVWLLEAYSSQFFYVIFATILVGLGIFLFIKNATWQGQNLFNKDKTELPNKKKPIKDIWLIPLGMIMGVLSSYLGIGGGWLLVPILIYVFKIPTHLATATSLLSLCIYSFVGVLPQLYYGNIDWMTVLFGGAGVILGANIGLALSQRLSGKIILQMLSILLIIIGIRMYFQ